MDDHRGPSPLQAVLLKAAAALVGVCVVIALGTLLVVRTLGLDGGSGGGGGAATTALEPEPVSPLPTTALPVPGQSDQPTSDRSHGRSGRHAHQTRHDNRPAKGLHLTATPAFVQPMERINLTGTYPHHDNMSLQVQRFEGGQWTGFAGVGASVHVGTFQTYVMTGRSGNNRFRVFDPTSGRASNAVTVTVG